MKKINKLFTLAVAVITLMPLTLVNAKNLNTKKSEQTQYLFVVTSDSGSLEYNNESKLFELNLDNVDQTLTYFSISPKKKTGFTKLAKFPKIFHEIDNDKNNSGLNAGLVVRIEDEQDLSTYTLTLKSIEYNKQDNKLAFTAQIIPGNKQFTIPHTARFTHIALFIDEGCASCSGGGL